MSGKGALQQLPLPSKLLVSKRAPTERIFGRLGTTRHRGRKGLRNESGGGSKSKKSVKQTFVDSLPAAACALDAATRALRTECFATLGQRAHVSLNGNAWRFGSVSSVSPVSSALSAFASALDDETHAEFLSRRMPWSFYATDGAESMLDNTHQSENPHVQLGVTDRDGRHLHAIVTTFLDATALWVESGRRIFMGKRNPSDKTPSDSCAPVHFATQHAALLNSRPLQWIVPDAYDGVVSRVIARLEDADVPTRFWVVCPVRSEALRRENATWFSFCDAVCSAAVKATPVPGAVAVLLPVIPGITKTSPVSCLEGLEHDCVRLDAGLALPPARILEAHLSAYLKMDESGAEPANFDTQDEDDEEEEEEEDVEKEKTEKTEKTETKKQEATRALKMPKALAFSEDEDLFIAVCDTRVAYPLVTFVVQNSEMRRILFREPDQEESTRDNDRDDENDVYDWGFFNKAYDWMAWTSDM
jgi:hypothetical protein